MAFLLLGLWIISICTSVISFMLMLNGKSMIEICDTLEIEYSRDTTSKWAKDTVDKKVKNMKNSSYFFAVIPFINIIQVLAVKEAIQTGYIKEILHNNF